MQAEALGDGRGIPCGVSLHVAGGKPGKGPVCRAESVAVVRNGDWSLPLCRSHLAMAVSPERFEAVMAEHAAAFRVAEEHRVTAKQKLLAQAAARTATRVVVS